MTLLPLRPPVKNPIRDHLQNRRKIRGRMDLGIEADSVLSVSSCKFLFDLLKNPLRLHDLSTISTEREQSSWRKTLILVLENLDSPAG